MILTSAMAPNPQPCIICGGSVARLWSIHSHVGDRYLRINPSYNVTGGMKVDFGGVVNLENASTDVDGEYKGKRIQATRLLQRPQKSDFKC